MTTKPQFTKPFNLDHAKAGAPYATRDGQEATILKWDGRHKSGYPLVGVYGIEDQPDSWRIDGFFGNLVRDHLDLVMTPLGFIDGKPVFVGDELVVKGAATPYTASSRDFKALHNLAWPAPAKAYPETRMTFKEMHTLVNEAAPGHEAEFRAIANAALRHAIDAGQVVTEAEHLCAIGIIQAKLYRAERALTRAGFVDNGAAEWTPPAGLSNEVAL